MRKLLKTICVLLSFVLFLLAIDLPTLKVNAAGTVDDFIGRCYQVTLGRDADSDGYAYWRDILVNRKQDGSVVAHGFLFSPEYIDKATSNEQYVKDLYMLFMGREPEQSGYDYWCEKMANGESREQIFAGFANSKEYFDLCYGSGITAGYYSADYDIHKINGVNLFVERMYQTSLDRLGDQGGQNDWVQALLEGRITGIECARSFVQSPEFINKGLSDEDYLKSLYKAFMGREYDQGGLNYWLGFLELGTKTRDQVFEGFANSPEFKGICANYGIECGSYTAKDVVDATAYNTLKKKADAICYSCAETTLRGKLKDPDSLQIFSETILESDAYFRYYIIISYSAKNSFGGSIKDTAYIIVRVSPVMDGTYYSTISSSGIDYPISDSAKQSAGWGTKPSDWSLAASSKFDNPELVPIKRIIAYPSQYEGKYVKIDDLVLRTNYSSKKRIHAYRSDGPDRYDYDNDVEIDIDYSLCDNLDDILMTDAKYQKITVYGFVKKYSNSTGVYIQAHDIIITKSFNK